MHQIVILLEGFQKLIDLEKTEFLGVGLDRYAHFGIICFLAFMLFYLRRPKWAVGLATFLIIAKEVLDLSVLVFYEPIRNEQYRDSVLDVLIGLGGLVFAYLVFKAYRKMRPG